MVRARVGQGPDRVKHVQTVKKGMKSASKLQPLHTSTTLKKVGTTTSTEKNKRVVIIKSKAKEVPRKKTMTAAVVTTTATRKVKTYTSQAKAKALLKTKAKVKSGSGRKSIKEVVTGKKVLAGKRKAAAILQKGKPQAVKLAKASNHIPKPSKHDSIDESSETKKVKVRMPRKEYMAAGFYCQNPTPSAPHQLVSKVLRARAAEGKAIRGNATASTSAPARVTRKNASATTSKLPLPRVVIQRPTLPPLPYDHGYDHFFGQQHDFDLPWSIRYEVENGLLTRKRKPTPFQKLRANVYPERPRVSGGYKAICKCTPESKCGDNCINRIMSYLCGKECPAGEGCENKTLTRRKGARYKVVDTGSRGFGVILTDDMQEGEFVMDYRGEVISMDTFMDRIHDEYKGHKNFYALEYDQDEVIDAGMRGNDARFINHGCAPNLEVRKYQTLGDGWEEYEVGMWALRDIKAGEELFYDYNFESFGVAAQSDELRTRCCCGAPNCVGFLGRKAGEKSAKELAAEQAAKAKLSQKGKKRRRKTVPVLSAPRFSTAVLALEGTPSSTEGSTVEASFELETPTILSPVLSEVVVVAPEPLTSPPSVKQKSERAYGAASKRKARKSEPIPSKSTFTPDPKGKEDKVKARNGAPKGWVYLLPEASNESVKPAPTRRPPRDRTSLG